MSKSMFAAALAIAVVSTSAAYGETFPVEGSVDVDGTIISEAFPTEGEVYLETDSVYLYSPVSYEAPIFEEPIEAADCYCQEMVAEEVVFEEEMIETEGELVNFGSPVYNEFGEEIVDEQIIEGESVEGEVVEYTSTSDESESEEIGSLDEGIVTEEFQSVDMEESTGNVDAADVE